MRVRIQPLSAFGSPIMSDTLWGQVCLAVLEMFGSDRLNALLANVVTGGDVSTAAPGAPFAVFSDGFAADALPKPWLEPHREADRPYDGIKAIKKRRFLSSDAFLRIRDGISGAELARAHSDAQAEPVNAGSVQQGRVRNSINRHTGRVFDGALFTSRETFFEAGIDIYVLLEDGLMTVAELREILAYMGETGYGRDRSVGLGRFEISSVEENPAALDPLAGANAFMSLSHGVPDACCQLHHGATKTKFGRHGGEWAVRGNPFKTPVVLYEPGSTFRLAQHQDVYGRCLDNVSANPGRHLHAAWLLPVFLRLEES